MKILGIWIDENAYAESPVTVNPLEFIVSWDIDYNSVISSTTDNDEYGIIVDIRDIGQHGYIARIGSSDADWGDNTFVGDIYSSGVIESGDSQFKYHGDTLLRGSVYYGQIRIIDEFANQSDWIKFSVRANALPVIYNIGISPVIPVENSRIILSYDIYDPYSTEGLTGIIRWYKNNVLQPLLNNKKSVDPHFVLRGDTWYATVIPNDGCEYGQRQASNLVTVSSPGTLEGSIDLVPYNPVADDILSVRYANKDMENNNNKIRWYINNDLLTEFNDKNSIRPQMKAGDIVRVNVYLSDGTDTSSVVSSGDIVISESSPRVLYTTIDNKHNNMNVYSVLPTLSIVASSEFRYISVFAGKYPGDKSIVNQIIDIHQDSFNGDIILDGSFTYGRTYYVSVAVSNNKDVFKNYVLEKFKTTGSLWGRAVDNLVGWSVNINFYLPSDNQEHCMISMRDGRYGNDVVLYGDKIRVYSGEDFKDIAIAYNSHEDKLSYNRMVLTGLNGVFKIYLNGVSIYNEQSSYKSIEKILSISGTDESTGSLLIESLNYSVSGDWRPGNTSDLYISPVYTDSRGGISNIVSVYDPIVLNDGASKQIGYVYSAINTDDNTSYISFVDSYIYDYLSMASSTGSAIMNISSSPNGIYKSISHSTGLTVVRGNLNDGIYDYSIDFSNGIDEHWDIVDNYSNIVIGPNGLSINNSG